VVTVLQGNLNSYSTTLPGGFVPDDTRMIKFTNWAKALEPWKTPLLDKIGYKEAINQPIFYFGQSYLPSRESEVEGSFSNVATTLNVPTGHGIRFQKNHVLGLFQDATDAFPTERVHVTSITADALTVKRGQGGDTPVAFQDADRILIIGTAESENDFHNLSPIARGTRNYNYFQRFEGGVGADMLARNMPTYEHPNDPMLSDFEQVTNAKKLDLEMALWFGHRQLGTSNPAAKVPPMLGGLDQLIVTNPYNLSGTPLLTGRVIDDVLYDMWHKVDASAAKTLVMSMRTKRLLNAYLNPIRRATLQDSTAGEKLEKIMTDTGEYPFTVLRTCPDGVIYLLDFSEMGVHPFAGNDWHITEKPGKFHGADHDQKFVSGTFTLSLYNEAAMAKITGFDRDLENYPDLVSGGAINVNVMP
jgi:hypothetical protein